jgi:hypothetical protein
VSGSTAPLSSRAKPTTGGRFAKAVIARRLLKAQFSSSAFGLRICAVTAVLPELFPMVSTTYASG